MSQQHEHTHSSSTEELRQHRRDYAVGLTCIVLSAIFFATAGVLCKLISWNAWSLSAGRSLFAAVVMYIYMRSRGTRFVVNKPTLIAAAINLVMFTTFLIANKLTTAANTIVLQFTEPVWVILFAWLLFKNRPRKEAAIACAVIFAGIVCFFASQLSLGSGIAGELFAILSGATYAGVFLFKKIPGCSFESASIISFFAAVVIGLPSVVGESDWSAPTLAMVIFMGVVQLGLAYVLLGRGLDSVSPVTASLTSTIEPVVNPILAAIVLGETLSPLSAVGAVLVIGAATGYNVWCARTGAE
ncbi:MAG: DMT family transporter [Coriobacteriales bacterium]